jgi:hypothetical protein
LDTGLRDTLLQAFAKCTTSDARTLLSKELLRIVMQKVDQKDEVEIDDSAFIDRIFNTIQNYTKQLLLGKEKTVRFDPIVMRVAMALWLDSPSSYMALRRNGLEVYPSPSTLYRHQRDT